MPVMPTYPGVYVEEVRSAVRTITGVATSITAFIGRALRGPVNDPVTLTSYADFERTFGGLWLDSALGYSVRDFYANGGSQAVVVRLFHPVFDTATEQGEALAAAEAVAAAAKDAVTATTVLAAVEAVPDPAAGPDLDAHNQIVGAANTAAGVPGATADDVVAAVVAEAPVAIAGHSAAQSVADNLVAAAQAANAPTVASNAARAKVTASYTGASPHEDAAADAVADAAEAAAALPGATPQSVADAAHNAIGQAAPVTKARLTVGTTHQLDLVAAHEGRWGNSLRVRIDHDAADAANGFNLWVRDRSTGEVEVHRNLSVAAGHIRRVDRVLERASHLVRVGGTLPASRPDAHPALAVGSDRFSTSNSTGVDSADEASDGVGITENADFTPSGAQTAKVGLYALERTDLFNLLVIPPYTAAGGVDATLIGKAATYCEGRRAMLLVDPLPGWDEVADLTGASVESQVGTSSRNAALFFPHLRQPNPLRDNEVETFAPAGAVAGVMARTDADRGVWKAPAGLDATLVGVPQLRVGLTDAEIGLLNPLGVNCLRAFPAAGRLIWGARTLQGDDRLASEWKYVSVRRLALFIEETLYRGTQWAVFEPNDEPLWSQLRLNVGAFMHHLFRQGAFQGSTPKEAYLVKCDSETTTQYDIDRGVVNLLVGFAPLKPAEFVIIQIQQLAGQNGV